MSTWKRDAASGLVILVPILVTFYIIYWLYDRIASLGLFTEVVANPVAGVVLTVAVFVLLVFATGYLMRTALGSLVERTLDGAANRLPGLRVVYNASKMAVETALSGTDDLQKPVKIEPWDGIRMTAFKTGKQTDDGREVLFMPTAPNITTGFVVEIESEDVVDVDETVEEALTRVLSAGFGEETDRRGHEITVTDAAAGPDSTAGGDGSGADD